MSPSSLFVAVTKETVNRGETTLRGSLRFSEKLVLVFLAYAALASFVSPGARGERATIWVLNAVAAGMLALLSRTEVGQGYLTTVRNWLPCVLIPLAYRESGFLGFFGPTQRLDNLFESWDTVLLRNQIVQSALAALSPGVDHYLEFCYLLCYPLIPAGLAAVVLSSRSFGGPDAGAFRAQAFDRYWTTVLMALLICYALFPFFPSTTPRLLFNDLPHPATQLLLLRKANAWFLGRYGIHSSVFPSAHVAGVMAVALAVRAHLRRRPFPFGKGRWGIVFLVLAISIAVATIVGRYHYTADAVTGALIGIAAAKISGRIYRRSGFEDAGRIPAAKNAGDRALL